MAETVKGLNIKLSCNAIFIPKRGACVLENHSRAILLFHFGMKKILFKV